MFGADMTAVDLNPSTKFTLTGQILQAAFRQTEAHGGGEEEEEDKMFTVLVADYKM